MTQNQLTQLQKMILRIESTAPGMLHRLEFFKTPDGDYAWWEVDYSGAVEGEIRIGIPVIIDVKESVDE